MHDSLSNVLWFRVCSWLLAIASPLAIEAQLQYTTNNGALSVVEFSGRGGLVTIPDNLNGMPVVSVLGNAFTANLNIAAIGVGQNVTNIGYFAFASCKRLTNASIGSKVAIIEFGAFEACFGLSQITMPDGLTTIGPSAFSDCFNLTSIKLGSSVTNLPQSVFASCSNLTSITIPKSVTSLGDGAFGGCPRLKSIFFTGDAPSGNSSVFNGDPVARAYYLPGTKGWGPTFCGIPTVLWNPQIVVAPDLDVRSAGLLFRVIGTPDIPLLIEASTDLTAAPWTLLLSCTLTNGQLYFSEEPSTNYLQRFYRIRSP